MMCTHKYMHILKNFFLDYTVLHIPGVVITYGLTIFKASGRVTEKSKLCMIKRKFSCSYMQFNGVNNKKHWRSLVVSGFLHYAHGSEFHLIFD